MDAQQLLLADDLRAGRIAVAEAAVGPLPGDARAVRVAAGQPGHGGSLEQCLCGQRHPQASRCATRSLPGAIADPRGTVGTGQDLTTTESRHRHRPERHDRHRRRGPGEGNRAAPPGVHSSASSRPGRGYRELHRRTSRVRRRAGARRIGCRSWSATQGDDHPPPGVADPAGDGGGPEAAARQPAARVSAEAPQVIAPTRRPYRSSSRSRTSSTMTLTTTVCRPIVRRRAPMTCCWMSRATS